LDPLRITPSLGAVGELVPGDRGAVAPALLPQPFAFISQWLPSGATVSALRNIVYLRDYQHLRPFVALSVWAIGLFIAWLTVGQRRAGSTPSLLEGNLLPKVRGALQGILTVRNSGHRGMMNELAPPNEGNQSGLPILPVRPSRSRAHGEHSVAPAHGGEEGG
jgi:hypothetical protein